MEGNYANLYAKWKKIAAIWKLWQRVKPFGNKTNCDFHFQTQISDPQGQFCSKQKMLTKIIV